MGSHIAPTNFPAPGAIAQGQPSTGVVQQAAPQPGTALKTFDPASVPKPVATPAPAAATATTTTAATGGNKLPNPDDYNQFYGPQYQGW